VVTRKPPRERLLDGGPRLIVHSVAAHRLVVLLAEAVHVHAEGEVLEGVNRCELFLQQDGVGAEVHVLLALHQLGDEPVDLGYMSGSPPGMLTIGAPHSSTAWRHFSTERFFLRIWAGYWILPQPAQARLQRKSGLEHQDERGSACGPHSFWRITLRRDRPHSAESGTLMG
jgi:hypothetical protein